MDDDDFFIPGTRQPQHERGNSGSRYGQPQRERGHSGPRYGHPQRERGHSGFLHGQPQREEGHSGPRYGQLQRERGHSGPQYGQLQRERSDSGSRYGQLQRERGFSGSRYGQLQRERGHSGPQNRQPQRDRGEISQASRPPHLSNNQRGKSNKHEHSTRHVGFLYLKNIANSADTDIIQNVNKQYESLFELLKSPVDRPDIFVLVMKIAHKVAGSTFDRLKIKFLLDLCNSQFIVYLRTYLMDLPYMSDEEKRANQMYWQKPDEFWESLVAFCECVINTAPSIAKSKCRSLIEDTSKLCLEKLSEIHKYALPIELSSKLNGLREAMKIVEEKMTVQINSKKTVALDQEDPPDNFRELSVLPTKDDLLVQKPFIRPNIIDGAYRDVEHYLDVQFRLLREDCFGPLRDGIYQYIKEPTKRRYDNIRVYQNVTFLRPYISNNKIGTVVQVDQRTTKNFKNIKWHYSQRLKFGTLLLLSKDNCKSFTSMTVMDREEHYLNKGQIPVEILDLNIGDEIYDGETYTMIESEVYFEPYQHVLRALQDPQFPNQLAMKKYIVDVDIQPSRPKYLEYIKEYKIYKNEEIEDIIFQPNHDIWPSRDDLGLNESQLEAYKVALTHEFAVIQGPPGTGKTHIGVEIAKTLLWNVSDIHVEKRFKCVMLLVCYTNHALDQFLEALLPYTKSIARIGGQSKNKALDDYNLSALRKKHRSCGFSDLRNEVNSTMSRLASLQNTISDACNGVLKIQVLEDALGSDVADKLEEYNKLYGTLQKSRRFTYGDPMGLWLFENVNIDYYELIDKRDIINEIHAYIGILNYKEDEDKKKKENEKETSFCFSVDEACKTILELVSIYETQIVLQEKVTLQRKIATLRGQIRLFTEMRDLYVRERRTNNPHDRNFSNLSVYDRWMLYFRWVDDFKEKQNHKMIDIKKTVSTLLKTYEEAILVQDCEVLSNVKIIGMTTSGAARLRKMIQNIGPPIVIVEEAAEVLEQHIITSLTKDCQHLILIGDHKQLRPSAAHMRLARQFNIEVSLFERMILNSVHSRRLCVQHRMRPEFARLLAPHIYPDLQNHPSVEHFPDVRGITTNLFFFTHDHKEVAEADSASKSNPKEADMVLLLANYIMQQGYGADDVTILAAYSGQMFYMRKERINYPHLDRIKITLVDNYQGEESKIILLSLVRNNDDNRIGFLGTENRICVALSRAREGFYIFGNINLLKTNSTLWSTIDKVLNEGDYVGTSLPLRCENHKNETNMISSAEDFQKVPEGGCLLRCDYKLVCGHQCALLCHSYGRDHKDIKCQMDCERKCEKNHPCPLKCRDPCRCKVRVTKKLPCGHENEVFCYEDPELVHCSTVLDVTLPLCGHQTKKQCWVDIKRIRCTVPCDHRLDLCGHACTRNCHVNHDPLHEKYECRKPCARANKECSNQSEEVPEDHLCKKLCYEPCDCCHVKVLKKRSTCAHRETVDCSQDVDKEPCKKKCTRMLPCGHYCKKLCSRPCGDCDQMVEKVIVECQHTVRIKCKLEPTRAMCTVKCERSLSCGHTCKLMCRDACDADKCTAPAAATFRAPCGHDVQPPCALARKFTPGRDDGLLLQYCTAACSAPLQCGHACAGDCSSCHQGRLHMPCAQPCGRQNFCGHICDEPCSKICPPCRKPCEVRCMHSKCTQLCGAPCSSCKEKCKRACAHGRCTKLCNQACTRAPCTQRCERRLACGHACRGYCGEPCPDVCKLCRPDQFPTDFLGDEFEDDAIFVVLEDCGHVLHSEDMENLMNGDQETIGVRKCPFCRRAIITTQRYKESINHMFKTNINPIKMKIYGNKKYIAELREELLKNLTESFAKIRVELLPEFLNDPIEKLYRLLISKVKYNKRCDNPQIQMYMIILNAIDLLFEYCQDYDKKRARTSVVRTQFDNTMEKQVKMLSIYLTKNVDLFSVQQQEDYQNELKRVQAMINLSQAFDDPIFADVRNNSDVAKAEKEAKSAILGCNIYNHEAGTRALKALQETTKIHYDPAKERAMIVKAIGLSSGHWFKCPNGHYYCIGECGGAMEVGRCPECKESIGGQRHKLLSTNRHAGEIDGSRFARYSEEANNMANFDLNAVL